MHYTAQISKPTVNILKTFMFTEG